MRILQIIETGGTGGAETVFVQLASGLCQHGHDVVCLTGNGNWLHRELDRRGIYFKLRHEGGSFDLLWLVQICKLIRNHKIDVVHAHLFDGSVYATLAARVCGIPCVATFHGQSDIKRSSLVTRIKATILRHLAHGVVAVSGALRTDLQRTLSIGSGRFHVIPNGLESVTSRRLPLRRTPRLHERDRSFRIIAVGNIRPTKDYHTMLRAVATLVERGLNTYLDVLGEPELDWLHRELLLLVDDLGLADRVSFHGYVPDPFPKLVDADCYVLSSSTEGFSLAIVEAMLSGVPIVATRCGGPQEILSDERTGLLVPTGDPAALAMAIERVLRDTNLGARLAEAARREAAQYSIGAMIDAYEGLYTMVVNRQNPVTEVRP